MDDWKYQIYCCRIFYFLLALAWSLTNGNSSTGPISFSFLCALFFPVSTDAYLTEVLFYICLVLGYWKYHHWHNSGLYAGSQTG